MASKPAAYNWPVVIALFAFGFAMSWVWHHVWRFGFFSVVGWSVGAGIIFGWYGLKENKEIDQ